MSLTGADSVANLPTSLTDETYNNTSNAPDVTPRTLTFVVNDGIIDSELSSWGSSGPAGLVGYWSFDEATGGTLHDLAGNGNDGTLNNMDPNTDWVSGQVGHALDFADSGGYVEIPYSEVFKPDGDFTITLWNKPGSVTGGTRNCRIWGWNMADGRLDAQPVRR
ncbi:MAG: hypothetical protein R3C56_21305 [Pirellulaceae bacterium]